MPHEINFHAVMQRAAAAPEDSGERQKFNAYLPGIAKRLRDVAQAAPAVAASLLSSDKDETVSNAYGGTGDVESGRGVSTIGITTIVSIDSMLA